MICPNCIEKMIEERRLEKIGKRVFLVCPKCGYNVPRANIKFYEEQERELFKKSQIKNEEDETN